ncbi:MAG: clan AA aspartic protease [Gemmatimonadetes bacterium]|nr:clan AA aspartic protease [Gemmatimonadota bacterium]
MPPRRRRPRCRLALPIALALAGSGCRGPGEVRVEVPPDSAAGEVRFTLAGPTGAALVVPVHVNGAGPYDFVFDTGATLTCIDQQLARKLGLRDGELAPRLGFALGGAGRVQVVQVDSLRIGRVQAFELDACIMDLPEVEALGLRVQGLVGLNFMKPFRVHIDFERRLLRLEEATEKANGGT